MPADTKKMRNSIKDLEGEKKSLNKKTETINETSKKLVLDKGELDKVKKFIESSDMPKEEKAASISSLEQQQSVVEDMFERDVEKPSDELDKEREELSKESKEYADVARENKGQLEGFRKQSGMDDSAIKGAAKEQSKLENDYGALVQDIEKDRQETNKFIEEQKNKVRGI
jgi:chromosome segregation ATPase